MYQTDTLLTELFRMDPRMLVVKFQGLIETIVLQFIQSGKFGYDERFEIRQQINEELLFRMDKIKAQYRGTASLKTYFAAIIRNLCHDILRKKISKPRLVFHDVFEDNTGNFSTISHLVIKEESGKLERVLDLYFRIKYRLILCLKLKYRMAYTFDDFSGYNRMIQQKDIDRFTEKTRPYINCPDHVIFSALTEIFNKYDEKKTFPDSLRKWVDTKIKELVEIMNGNADSSNYTEDTLQILFEFSYASDIGESVQALKKII